jgi:hypothetical protein
MKSKPLKADSTASEKAQASVASKAPSPARAWSLGNARAVRKRLTGEIRAYTALIEPTKVETDHFKALVFAYSVLASILRDEHDTNLDGRVRSLEAMLNSDEKGIKGI